MFRFTQKIGGFSRRQYYLVFEACYIHNGQMLEGKKILCDPTLFKWDPRNKKIRAVHFRMADEVIQYKRPSFGDPKGKARPPLRRIFSFILLTDKHHLVGKNQKFLFLRKEHRYLSHLTTLILLDGR